MIKKIINFIKESKEEVITRTTWPTLQQLAANSIVLFVTLIILAIILLITDTASSFIVRNFYKILNS